jgi:hypothetical protein
MVQQPGSSEQSGRYITVRDFTATCGASCQLARGLGQAGRLPHGINAQDPAARRWHRLHCACKFCTYPKAQPARQPGWHETGSRGPRVACAGLCAPWRHSRTGAGATGAGTGYRSHWLADLWDLGTGQELCPTASTRVTCVLARGKLESVVGFAAREAP